MTGTNTIADTSRGPRPYWISFEGVEGVGKTHFLHKLSADLGPGCVLLDELTDTATALPRKVITALSSTGDPFLRTGHPRTETLALLALKVREQERVTMKSAHTRAHNGRDEDLEVVLEDRGIDSVAVYQSLILTEANTQATTDTGDTRDGSPASTWAYARQIYRTAARWCSLPDRTVLLTDDLDACCVRFIARTGLPLADADRRVIEAADRMYRQLAREEPDRFAVVVLAGRSTGDVLDELRELCRPSTATGRSADRSSQPEVPDA